MKGSIISPCAGSGKKNGLKQTPPWPFAIFYLSLICHWFKSVHSLLMYSLQIQFAQEMIPLRKQDALLCSFEEILKQKSCLTYSTLLVKNYWSHVVLHQCLQITRYLPAAPGDVHLLTFQVQLLRIEERGFLPELTLSTDVQQPYREKSVKQAQRLISRPKFCIKIEQDAMQLQNRLKSEWRGNLFSILHITSAGSGAMRITALLLTRHFICGNMFSVCSCFHCRI